MRKFYVMEKCRLSVRPPLVTQSGHRCATNLGHFLGVTALIIPVGIVCTERFNGKIDKHADRGRQMTSLWKDRIKSLRRHAVLIEQADKSPGPDIRSGYERR